MSQDLCTLNSAPAIVFFTLQKVASSHIYIYILIILRQYKMGVSVSPRCALSRLSRKGLQAVYLITTKENVLGGVNG